MKITECLKTSNAPIISFEIIPPNRGESISRVMGVVSELVDYKPPFIDVTSHAAQPVSNSGKTRRKRPGTLPICILIQERYNIETVPHVLCHGFTREETEDFLIEINYAGIKNVMALQGDSLNYQKLLDAKRTVNVHAIDLVRQIKNMNNDNFLDDLVDADKTDFSVGVAGYPEKHSQAISLETDLKRLKEKVSAGADYIVTQMFFDNRFYFDFVKRCADIGIEVPIIPGLKVLTSAKQLEAIPYHFRVSIPGELSDSVINSSSPLDAGVSWAVKQAEELLRNGAPSIHFYVMQNVEPIHQVVKYLN